MEKNVPAIRFVGFSERWELRKIEKLALEKKRPIELVDHEQYQLLTVKRRNGGVIPRILLKGKNILVKTYFEVRTGDYLISKRQVVHGANGLVTKELDKAVVSNEYLVIVSNNEITSEFWSIISKRPDMYKIFLISSYGVDIEKLFFDVNDWKKRAIRVPSISEQTQIGELFQQLDRLIAQHQQKHGKLTQIKKALLEKMFPQQGETTPAIRFKGFSGEWEKKPLDDVVDIVGGGTPSTAIDEYWNGNIDWYSPTEIGKDVYAYESVKKITPLGLKKSSAKILPARKTVLFTSRAGIGDMAVLMKDGCTNQGFQSFVMKEKNDAYFVFSSGRLIKKYALKHASGSTFLEISGKELGKMNFKLPNPSEQTQIGNLFQQLDALITQHKTQLTKLNNIKQSLLSKLFV